MQMMPKTSWPQRVASDAVAVAGRVVAPDATDMRNLPQAQFRAAASFVRQLFRLFREPSQRASGQSSLSSYNVYQAEWDEGTRIFCAPMRRRLLPPSARIKR